MGVFDVRCAVSGLVLRSGRVLVLPLVRAGKEHRAVGLPIAGEYDRYGGLDPFDRDPVAAHFAKALTKQATWDEKPSLGLEAFLDVFTATDEIRPRLGKREVKVAYVHEGVYRALVAEGKAKAKAKGDVFPRAFAEADAARALYVDAPPAAKKALAKALEDFAASRLGHDPLSPTKEAHWIQSWTEECKASLGKARKALAKVKAAKAVLDDYELRVVKALEAGDEDEDDDDE